MKFDMNDQKKAFWDGFFSVFNFSGFLNPSDDLPENLDGIREKMSWGLEKDWENLQNDAEKVWGKVVRKADLISCEDGRGDENNQVDRGKN